MKTYIAPEIVAEIQRILTTGEAWWESALTTDTWRDNDHVCPDLLDVLAYAEHVENHDSNLMQGRHEEDNIIATDLLLETARHMWANYDLARAGDYRPGWYRLTLMTEYLPARR